MKCPKCGFVSFSGLAQCKKCGQRFVSPGPERPASRRVSGIEKLSFPLIAETDPATRGPLPAGADDGKGGDQGTRIQAEEIIPSSPVLDDKKGGDERPPFDAETTPGPAAEEALPTIDAQPRIEMTQPPEAERPWREELTERVQNFRRRRARLRQGYDPSASLNLEFENIGNDKPEADLSAKEIQSPEGKSELDFVIGTSTPSIVGMPVLDSLPLEKAEEEFGGIGSATGQSGGLAFDQGAVEPQHMEIVLESFPPSPHGMAGVAGPQILPVAPLGRRFLAGLLDLLVLQAGSGLFALIFWQSGGRISLQPLNLWVLGFIAAVFVFSYFGLFTAVASRTPGLLWTGLEVRNLDGTTPTVRDSFWRGFGYLVSVAALMIGFVWALVDSDGMTWHDRMSDTYVTSKS